VIYWFLDWVLEGQPYAYQNIMFRSTMAILTGFVAAIALGPRIIRYLRARRIGDVPEFYHDKLNEMTRMKGQTPTMGGLIILGGILAGTVLWARLNNFYVEMGLFCLLWLGLLGMVDDYLKLTSYRRSGGRDGLKMWEKMVFQVGLGVVLAYYVFKHGSNNWPSPDEVGPFRQLTIPFYKPGVSLAFWAFTVITVVVITGTSNAVNLTDGMDGLASGCMALVGFVFMLLSFVAGTTKWATYLLLPPIPFSEELAVICGSLVGACLGFLWYNCHPAQVFMGDTGSLAMGGLVGYVAIVTRQELMLLIVGGVFVIEALSVILQVGYFKLTKGRRLFLMAPIHHHFHLKGWPESKVVVRFWLLAAVFAALALVSVKLR